MRIHQNLLAGICGGFATLLLLMSPIALAEGDDAFPVVHHSGDISFCSGGIGIDEVRTMKALTANYPLALTFISRIDNHDTYTAPDQVVIVKADGSPVLDIKPDGPMLLIDLPAGKYRITAGSAAQSAEQSVQLVKGAHRQLVFKIANGEADTSTSTSTNTNTSINNPK